VTQVAELRFILLIAGLVFLVALAAWELRKPRQAAPGNASLRRAPRNEPEIGSFNEPGIEPGIGPGIAPMVPATRLRPSTTPPRIDLPEPRVDLPALEAIRAESILANGDSLPVYDLGPMTTRGEPLSHSPVYAQPEPQSNEPESSEPRRTESSAVAAAPAAPVSKSAPSGADESATVERVTSPALAPSLIVEWPPEGERHIVALRLVPAANERLSGRAVRLAITGCGFVHGPLGIYHQPDGHGRAIVSVASLSKPGVLDPLTLDFQRLAGLNLFSVLPGPLSPAAALDHLLETARELSQRLPARVQTDQGQPLDADRLEDLRDRMQTLSSAGLRAEPAA
jgi:FtsZ-interacting cell division protein ZipA